MILFPDTSPTHESASRIPGNGNDHLTIMATMMDNPAIASTASRVCPYHGHLLYRSRVCILHQSMPCT